MASIKQGESVLITGASSGLGAALARQAAAAGAVPILAARRQSALTDLADELKAKHGLTAPVVTADLGTAGGADSLVAALDEAELAPTGVIANAGLGRFSDVADQDRAAIDSQLMVNVTETTRLLHSMADRLRAQRHGGILVVGSSAGFGPVPGMAPYAATKAYLASLTLALGEELRPAGVTVTLLSPGPIRTPFFANAGLGEDSRVRRLMEGAALSAERVARDGWRGLQRGRRHVIPGGATKALAVYLPLLPLPLKLPVTARILR